MATSIDKNVLRWGWLLSSVIALGCGGTPAFRDGAPQEEIGPGPGRGEALPLDLRKDVAPGDLPASSDLVIGVDAAIDEGPTDVPITCMPECVAPQVCTMIGQCETFCAQGQTNCPGKGCTELATDSTNCGLCGQSCPQGQFCSEGKCAKMCGQGESKCGTSCVKLDTNYGNCGLCAFTCHDAEACVARICRCESPNQVCSNICTNVINNRQNCGACGNRCNGDLVCNGRNCGCPGGRQLCPNKANTCVTNLNDCCNGGELWCGRCQNVVSDKNNCGGCGRSCPGVEVCSNRSCGCPSSQPKSCGGGVCIPNGQCCSGTKSCGGGVCIPNDQCCAGQKSCGGGVCIPAGQCCTGTKSCGGGVCIPNDQCCAGQKSCGGGRCIAANQCCDDRPQCGTTCCPSNQVCASNACVTPVDCKVGPFGEWSTCDKECGTGSQTRSRSVVTPPSNGGAACPSLTETRSCMIKECPVDCKIGFPDFGACSAKCGGGTQSRTATIVTRPVGDGQPCPNPLPTETRACNTQDCAVDCVKGPFECGKCSADCGPGVQKCKETVVTPASGGGKCDLMEKEEACNSRPCEPPGGGNGGDRGNQ